MERWTFSYIKLIMPDYQTLSGELARTDHHRARVCQTRGWRGPLRGGPRPEVEQRQPGRNPIGGRVQRA